MPAIRPVTRVAACAVIRNPLADVARDDLGELVPLGAELGDLLVRKALAVLPNAPVSYGKAAIVGLDGDIEHAAAILHPRMGKPMREAIGGGKAIIPSNVKVAAAGPRSTCRCPTATTSGCSTTSTPSRWPFPTRRGRARSWSSLHSPMGAGRGHASTRMGRGRQGRSSEVFMRRHQIDGRGPRDRLHAPPPIVELSAVQSPNGYVSGISSVALVSNGVTALVWSNQIYSSNCCGRIAWK